MFVDASAIVAILTRGACCKRHASVTEAQEDMFELLRTAAACFSDCAQHPRCDCKRTGRSNLAGRYQLYPD